MGHTANRNQQPDQEQPQARHESGAGTVCRVSCSNSTLQRRAIDLESAALQKHRGCSSWEGKVPMEVLNICRHKRLYQDVDVLRTRLLSTMYSIVPTSTSMVSSPFRVALSEYEDLHVGDGHFVSPLARASVATRVAFWLVRCCRWISDNLNSSRVQHLVAC
eukprot:825179-Amphidinium_carterae.1